MGPGEIVASGEALSKLGVIGLLCVVVIALGTVVVAQWRESKAASKFWMDKFVATLEAQFTDATRRKDLFDELGRAIDGQAQATRDLRQEFANLRSDIQRGRP
jgi:hypothetical protein